MKKTLARLWRRPSPGAIRNDAPSYNTNKSNTTTMNLLKRIAVLAVAALSLLAVHAQSRDSITTVYVIFKTHLDVGFTDLSSKVEQNYLNEFIPKALDVAERLRADRSGERYVWTTGAWLVWEYLHQAPPADVKRLERAIRRGDIVWNGVPYTVESEAMNRALFEGGLALSARLDKRYHRHTVAAKMTDVPGHTRSIIAPLTRAGIRFLHVGVNPACTVPGVPPLLPLARPRGLRNRPRLPAGLRHRAHPEPHSLPRQRGRTLWPQLLHRLPRPARAASTST